MNVSEETIAFLQIQIDGLKGELHRLEESYNNCDGSSVRWVFILLSAFNIFLMQAGFALVEVGSVRSKNSRSILFKNTLDVSLSMMVWWILGFGVAGGGASGQQGNNFILISAENSLSFVHSYTFANTCTTIVSGGVAERMSFSSYLVISAVMVGLIYPVLCQWSWAQTGWLSQLGFLDFAGSGIVHLCGGTAAIVCACIIGPRIGRFKNDNGSSKATDIKGHSPVLSNLGTFILIYGWLSFNSSSVLGATVEDLIVASRVVVNTLISIASSSLTYFTFSCILKPRDKPSVHELGKLNNSMLSGAVAITAGCAFVKSWAAVIIGIVAFFVYYGFSHQVTKLQIDDPLEASAVHGACGIWGLIAVGLFSHPDYAQQSYGLLLGDNAYLLGVQILGGIVIMGWTSFFVFALCKVTNLIPHCALRVEKDAELLGLDFAYHDGFVDPGLKEEDVEYFREVRRAHDRVANKARPQIPPQVVKDFRSSRKIIQSHRMKKYSSRKLVVENSSMEYSSEYSSSEKSVRLPMEPASKELCNLHLPQSECSEFSYCYSSSSKSSSKSNSQSPSPFSIVHNSKDG